MSVKLTLTTICSSSTVILKMNDCRFNWLKLQLWDRIQMMVSGAVSQKMAKLDENIKQKMHQRQHTQKIFCQSALCMDKWRKE